MRTLKLAWYDFIVMNVIRVGNLTIHPFSLATSIGLAIGVIWALTAVPRKDYHKVLDACFWTFIGGFAISRLAFAAINWVYFQDHLGEIFQFWMGGLTWPGAFAGAILSLAILSLLRKHSFGELVCLVLPLGTCLTISSWLGCWSTGCGYGSTSQAWWALSGLDEWGAMTPRIPTQLLGALSAILSFYLFERYRSHHGYSLPSAFTGLAALSGSIWITSLFRADPTPGWYGHRVDVLAAAGFTIVFALSWIVHRRVSQRLDENHHQDDSHSPNEFHPPQ